MMLKIIKKIVEENLLEARAIVGFWPASRVDNNDVIITDDSVIIQ